MTVATALNGSAWMRDQSTSMSPLPGGSAYAESGIGKETSFTMPLYDGSMPAGRVHALYLFEVGDAIDVRALSTLVDATAAAPLTMRPASPPYLQYQQPPMVIAGAALGVAAAGHVVRFTVYDYGIVAVTVTEPLPDSWDDVVELAQRWQDNPRILAEAERCCR